MYYCSSEECVNWVARSVCRVNANIINGQCAGYQVKLKEIEKINTKDYNGNPTIITTFNKINELIDVVNELRRREE